ncbi:hypothetical protein [Corynebacterium pygosceleis]|uniref:hypothetical protein n=1 Tax=Corynebacterium pygosceleis TaxID=2800406 RepID=UPI00200412EC|nr:hypothetical protein [Corynebacterium pygosceleis]MCK7674790.1 hypothetical protein [Corynebacterium pygosceleis]
MRGDVTRSPDLTGMDRPARVRALRATLATMGGGPVRGDAEDVWHRVPGVPSAGVVPVPENLADCLPRGGLLRREVTAVGDCPALVIELIAAATGNGARVAVVGWPDLLLAGIPDAGGNLDRVVVIPDPGPRPFAVTGMLVEGMDLVIHRWNGEDTAVGVSQARPLLARTRRGTAALIVIGARLPAPSVRIGADIVAYHGIGAGSGRIRGFDIAVEVTVKAAPPRRALLRVGCTPVETARTDGHPISPWPVPRVVRTG